MAKVSLHLIFFSKPEWRSHTKNSKSSSEKDKGKGEKLFAKRRGGKKVGNICSLHVCYPIKSGVSERKVKIATRNSMQL